jgi:hypothetical protein
VIEAAPTRLVWPIPGTGDHLAASEEVGPLGLCGCRARWPFNVCVNSSADSWYGLSRLTAGVMHASGQVLVHRSGLCSVPTCSIAPIEGRTAQPDIRAAWREQDAGGTHPDMIII